MKRALLSVSDKAGIVELATALADRGWEILSTGGTAQALRDRGFAGPILALTANVLAVDRQRCMDAGCDAFLGKPIRVKQLITVCAGLLAQPEIPYGVAT